MVQDTLLNGVLTEVSRLGRKLPLGTKMMRGRVGGAEGFGGDAGLLKSYGYGGVHLKWLLSRECDAMMNATAKNQVAVVYRT
jgi:hypothetical protein